MEKNVLNLVIITIFIVLQDLLDIFFYTQNSFIAKAIILQLSIELLVTIVHSTLHKTTNPPECSRPSHPISRGY